MEGKYELKVCAWCGKSFYGFHNDKYCGKVCRDELLNAKAAAKREGRSSKTEDVIDMHKEKLRKRTTRFHRELVAVHLSSSSVQWRYVNRR